MSFLLSGCCQCQGWYLGKLYPDLDGDSPRYFLPQPSVSDQFGDPYRLDSVAPIPGESGAIVSGWFSVGDNEAKPRYARLNGNGGIVWVVDKPAGHENNAVIRVGDDGDEFVTGYTKWAGTDAPGSVTPLDWANDWIANPPRVEFRSVADGSLNSYFNLSSVNNGFRNIPYAGSGEAMGQGDYTWISDIQANGDLDVVFCTMHFESYGTGLAWIVDNASGAADQGRVWKVPYGTTTLDTAEPIPWVVWTTNPWGPALVGGIAGGQPGHPGDVRVLPSIGWWRDLSMDPIDPSYRFQQSLSATFADTGDNPAGLVIMGRVPVYRNPGYTGLNSPGSNGGYGLAGIGVPDFTGYPNPVNGNKFETGKAQGRFDPGTWGSGWGGKVLAQDGDPDTVATRLKGFGSVSGIDYNWGSLAVDNSPISNGLNPADDVRHLQLGFCLDGQLGVIRTVDPGGLNPMAVERRDSSGVLWTDPFAHVENLDAECWAVQVDGSGRLWAVGEATKPG